MDDATDGEQSLQCELCDRPVEVPDRCELHNRMSDVEKLKRTIELVTEVKKGLPKEDMPTMGNLLAANREIRYARDRLRGQDD